jgi:hypothetical protein
MKPFGPFGPFGPSNAADLGVHVLNSDAPPPPLLLLLCFACMTPWGISDPTDCTRRISCCTCGSMLKFNAGITMDVPARVT